MRDSVLVPSMNNPFANQHNQDNEQPYFLKSVRTLCSNLVDSLTNSSDSYYDDSDQAPIDSMKLIRDSKQPASDAISQFAAQFMNAADKQTIDDIIDQASYEISDATTINQRQVVFDNCCTSLMQSGVSLGSGSTKAVSDYSSLSSSSISLLALFDSIQNGGGTINAIINGLYAMNLMSDLAYKIVQCDYDIIQLNTTGIDFLNNVYEALTNLGEISFPYTDDSTGDTANNIYELIQLAYAGDGNEELQSLLDPLMQVLETADPNAMDTIINSDYATTTYDANGNEIALANVFNTAFTQMMSTANQYIGNIGTSLDTLTSFTTTSGTVDGITVTYIVPDSATIGTNSTALQTAIEGGNTVSNDLDNQFNAASTSYQQIWDVITSILSTFSSIASKIWY